MNERITPYDPELAKSITKEGQRIVRELTHALEDKISMNERIKELIAQAKDHADHLDKIGVDTSMEDIFNQKFAELIVEECAQRAEAYAYMSQNFVALAEELRRMKQNG